MKQKNYLFIVYYITYSYSIGGKLIIILVLLDKYLSLRPVVLNQVQFCPPPRRHWQCLEIHLIVTSGDRRRYWHLVDRGQGCCSISYRIEDSLHSEELSGPKGSNAEIKECIIDLTVKLCSYVKVVVQAHNLLPLIPKCP